MSTDTAPPATPAPTTPGQGRPLGRGRAALLGMVAVLLTVAVAELLAALAGWAGLLSSSASPVGSLGGAFIDVSPGSLVEWAKQNLGAPGDKVALGIGMGLTLLLAGALIGLVARVRLTIGLTLAVLLAVVAAVAIESRADAGVFELLPLAIGAFAGCRYLWTALRPRYSTGTGVRTADRRQFLMFAGYGALGAAIAGALSRMIPSGAATAESRAAVTLPTAEMQSETGVQTLNSVPGISSYVTPNADFYRIDTAFVLPQVPTAGWKLRIHGMVDKEIEIDFAALAARPMLERMITLTCVSNPRGGDLVGNARWIGTRIADLLAEAGPQAGADCVLSADVKGFTVSTPLEALTDDRDSLLAIGMNGEPLPVEHGFPVRMVVPGLYGYVSATKWVVDMEVTRFDKVMAYWTGLGWSDHGPIKTSSRIDVPGDTAAAGQVPVAGVAWAQHRGISGVQVQINAGDGWSAWADAELSRPVSTDTWVQWVYRWDAKPGDYKIHCRAIDLDGKPQIGEDSDVIPDGATGYHQISVTVTA
ncbi:molybdopterin-dependent oxidoreductase [Nakamurella lactea]|uniref:molybdopterin-dependent oxidoreductase n=1 Tax=Nakamurella lactea TaxID=459515 RepID=UPI0004105422|nr:molybdopterin-dependent oxidoreductase [Nakamurella lactea]